MEHMVAAGADGLWVDDSGGAGEPLVLLHPGIGDLRTWDLVQPALAQDFRVVRYDFRGYGRSLAPTEPYDYLTDLATVLDAVGLESAHLVGNSQGGATAVALALARPERVRSLVLLAPAVGGWQPDDDPDGADPETDARFEAAAIALGNGQDGPMTDLMLELWCAAGYEPFVMDQVRESLRSWPGEEQHLRALPDARKRLGELAAPTVLLLGDRDFAPLVRLNEQMAASIPGCRLLRLAGVDHLPQVRVPDLVAEVIRGHCVPR